MATKKTNKSANKGLKAIKEVTKQASYEEAAIADCLDLMITGAWTPAALVKISQKYSKNVDNDKHGLAWARKCAHVAAHTLKQLQQYSTEDKEFLVSDLTSKLYSIYEQALNRTKNVRKEGKIKEEDVLSPDYNSAIAAINSIAKLHNLYAADANTTINIQPQYSVINKLTKEEMAELRATGQIPKSVLNDWKAEERQELPGIKSYNPSSHPILGEFVEDPEAIRRKKLNEQK